MKALTYMLELLEPVLIKQVTGGDPNSGIGSDFISGSAMRGAVIGCYLAEVRRSGHPMPDGTDDRFRHLFLDGAICYLNAYPAVNGSERSLPLPLSWYTPKDGGDTIYDFAFDRHEGDTTIYKRVWERFCHLRRQAATNAQTGSEVETLKPRRQVNIHTARADRQRVTGADSTVFRYDALAAGQVFCGTILAESEADLTTIDRLLPQGMLLRIGGSHNAGYGTVRYTCLHPTAEGGSEQNEFQDWREYTQSVAQTNRIIVTLLSDTLLRDPATGGYSADLLPVLGVPHSVAFRQTRIVGGFNRTWNLPLPQVLAIQAGSVFVYETSDSAILDKAKKAVEQGIGERRAEGFGRIALNWQAAPELQRAEKHKAAAKHQPGQQPALPANLESLAQRMLQRMLRAELDQRLVQTINSLNLNGTVQNAQLSQIRTLGREVLLEGKTDKLVQHLDPTHMKAAARNQFERARLNGVPLGDWIRNQLANVRDIAGTLGVNLSSMPQLGSASATIDDRLALEYTIRLIDGVMHKALEEAKQSRNRPQATATGGQHG